MKKSLTYFHLANGFACNCTKSSLWNIFVNLRMSVRDITSSSNCKIDERTPTNGGILALRKSIILAQLSAGHLVAGRAQGTELH